MMNDFLRTGFRSALAGAILTASAFTTVSAQVASLEDPGASPTPGTLTEAATSPVAGDPQEAMLQFAECMREHDISMDDPQFTNGGGGFIVMRDERGPGGFDPVSEEFQTAQEACGPILEATRPQLDPAAEAERLDQQLAMAQCLRDHGIRGFPDPVISSEGSLQRFGGPESEELPFDPFSDEFESARQACATELGIEPGLGGPAAPGAPAPAPAQP